MEELSLIEKGKQLAGYKACDSIRDGMKIGLGTGSTAYYAIERVGQLVVEGMKLQAVATSLQTARLARERNIPLLDINEVTELDVVIDGVDEIDPQFNAVKGGGGALFREKMVALLGKEVIWVMDDRKPVEKLGVFPLPLEILPFGAAGILARLDKLELKPRLRLKKEYLHSAWQEPSVEEQLVYLREVEHREKLFVTDNHNYIVDLLVGPPLNLEFLQKEVRTMVGVLETGLFLNMCSKIYIGGNGEVTEKVNPFLKGE